MAQSSQQESHRVTTYRLQTTAYVNRLGRSSPTKIHIDSGRYDVSIPPHGDTPSRPRERFNTKLATDSMFNHKTKQRSKSLQQLSIIDTDFIFGQPQRIVAPTPLAGFEDKFKSTIQKHSYNNRLSFLPSSTSIVAYPQNNPRPKTARLNNTQAPVSTVSRHRRRRFSMEEDPTKVAMKISLPCTGGCCYCVFSALLGPVKVYIRRADTPKKEPLLVKIKDGNGKPIIPVSRKSDVKGLVYDPVSFSLHPPVKGHRPMLQTHQKQRK